MSGEVSTYSHRITLTFHHSLLAYRVLFTLHLNKRVTLTMFFRTSCFAMLCDLARYSFRCALGEPELGEFRPDVGLRRKKKTRLEDNCDVTGF